MRLADPAPARAPGLTRGLWLWAGLFLVTACTPVADRPGVRFVPDAGGLGIANSPQRIDFGRAPAGVIAALDRELGPHRVLSLAPCPADVVRQLAWGGLVLTFTAERFAGWRDDADHAGPVCG